MRHGLVLFKLSVLPAKRPKNWKEILHHFLPFSCFGNKIVDNHKSGNPELFVDK